MKNKVAERNKARELRQEGKTINEIAKELTVSKSSVSGWVREIELTEEQLKRIKSLSPRFPSDRGKQIRKDAKELRLSNQLLGRSKAKTELNDSLFIAGCMLFWAEGKKSRNVISLGNTDSALLKLFCRFLREKLLVLNKDITIYVRLHSNSMPSLDEVKNYWKKQLDIEEENFRTISIDVDKRIVSGKKTKIHPYGNVTVQVNRTDLVQQVYGFIQEYAGFDNPEWIE